MNIDMINAKSRELNTSKMLTKGNISDMKYLADFIPSGELEDVETGMEFFKVLKAVVGEEEFATTLSNLLEAIQREDVIEILKGTKGSKIIPTKDAMEHRYKVLRPELKFDQEIMDYIAVNIGSDWRRLARFLRVTDNEIDTIEEDCRKTKDKSYETLKIWLTKTSEVTVPSLWQELRVVLQKLPRIDMMQEIESKFAEKLAQRESTIESIQDSQGDEKMDYKEYTTVNPNRSHPGNTSNMILK